MNEGTKALRAVRTWDAWGQALARGGDLEALLAGASPRIAGKRPPTRVRLTLAHHADAGQLGLEIRVDYGGAPKVEVELDGVVYRESTAVGDRADSQWSALSFGAKYLEVQLIHEAVPKLMDAVYARSSFVPQLPELVGVARIGALETAVDATLGAAQRIHFRPRDGKDERVAYQRMGFLLTDRRGAPVTEADELAWEARYGPNGAWPSGVAWRREDGAVIDGTTACFGANARKMFAR